MKQLLQPFFYIFFISSALLSQSTMEVNDPQLWWNESPGHVENVDIQIKPIGLYSEVQLAFDVMASTPERYNPEDQLEFVIQFEMPENVVFNDSWLWINSYISVGEIYEVNEGTQIYEDIVDRRQDPSILTKHSGSEYSLKIYPLKPDSTRRVMLSYLTPLTFDDRFAQIDLPLNIIEASSQQPQNVNLKIVDSQNWGHLDPDQEVFTFSGSSGDEYNYKLNDFTLLNSQTFTYMPDDMTKPYYFGSYSSAEENFYQLAYFPEIEVEGTDGRTMVVLDFDDRNADDDITVDEVLTNVQNQLISNLTDGNFFNICYSKFVTKFASDNWIPATRSNIEMAFDLIRNENVDGLSNLTTLLPEALTFVESQGQDADIKIISANVEINSLSDANAYIKVISEFIETMTSTITISVLDFSRYNQGGYWVGNQYFVGNEYFYNLLTTLGNGKYFHARYLYEVKKDIEEILEANLMLISDYDFDIEATDGFAYSNYINLSQGNQIDINQPIIATGKYVGDSPFNIEFRGFYNGNIFNENIVIDSGDEINVTFQAEQVWHANYILENEFSTNTFIANDVIEVSKEQNLLSAKTIFLCLEPDTSSISSNNLNGIDEEDLVIATEDVALNNAIEVFPNPFVDNITVKIPSTENSGSKEFQLKLINTKGQLVASYNLNPTLVGDYYRLVWDIDFALQSGMYIVEILSENFIAHKNIIHLK